jgi:hypothetical protein
MKQAMERIKIVEQKSLKVGPAVYTNSSERRVIPTIETRSSINPERSILFSPPRHGVSARPSGGLFWFCLAKFLGCRKGSKRPLSAEKPGK